MDAAVRATPLRETASLFVADFRVPISFVVVSAILAVEAADGRLQPAVVSGFPASAWWGVALVLCGVLWRSWAAGTLRKGQRLATLGPYSLVRHPLYFGSGLMLLGFCQLTCSPLHYLPLVAVMAAVYANTMLREERFLSQKYAADWPAYRNRTPRILPWSPQLFARGTWSFEQWRKNHEYRASSTALAALAGLGLLRWLEATGFFAAR
jgi:protein-S-isoprenylcysteine O-methyltransferase Ste14